MNSTRKDDLCIFQCALESQQKSVCDTVFQNGENTVQGIICVRDHTFMSVDFNALGYSIANTSFHVTELVFTNCILSLEGAQSFTECVGHEKLSHIKSFAFSANGELKQFNIVNHILKKLQYLETLGLENVSLDNNDVKYICCEVKLLNLKVLKIRMPVINCFIDSLKDCLSLLSFNSKSLNRFSIAMLNQKMNLTNQVCSRY